MDASDRRRAVGEVDGQRRFGCPASRSRRATSRAARRTRSTRSVAATSMVRCASHRTTAPESRDAGILREWRIIEALDGTDVPHTPAIAACADKSVLGRSFYLMGFVDGWSPMKSCAELAGAVRHRSRGPRRASPTSSSRASPCSATSTGRRRACRTSAGPTASTSARSIGGQRFLERIKGRELPGLRRGRGLATRPQARSTTSPGSCTATTSSPT